MVGQNTIDQLPNIPANKGLAAGQIHTQNTAFSHLVNQMERLLGGKFSQQPFRRIHKTMAAAVIAFASDRPKYISNVSIFIILIVLIVFHRASSFAGLNPTICLTLLQRFFQCFIQQATGQLRFSITESQYLKLFLGQILRPVFRAFHKYPGHSLPTTQDIRRLHSIIHCFFLISLYQKRQTDREICLPLLDRYLSSQLLTKCS